MTDKRGWTLLHIAASKGDDQTVRHLLSIGADQNSRSRPCGSDVAESLYHRRCTPGEVAAVAGQEELS